MTINPDSILAYRGLEAGDVIVATNRIRVTDIKEFAKALKQRQDKILLRVIRGRSSFYVVIQ